MGEKKYIDADAFIAEKRALYCEDCNRRRNTKGQFCYEIGDAPCRACEIDDMLDAVEDYPAADVVEVVRCKDCVHCDKVDDWEYWCRGRGFPYVLTVPDGYCYKGEKENEE